MSNEQEDNTGKEETNYHNQTGHPRADTRQPPAEKIADPAKSSSTMRRNEDPFVGRKNDKLRLMQLQVKNLSLVPPPPPPSTTDAAVDPPGNRKRTMARRLNLFLQVRILLKILEKEGNIQMRSDVQLAMKECQRRNRAGDTANGSLASSIERAVRGIVGERRWRQAELCVQVVISKKVPPSQRAQKTKVGQAKSA